MKAVCLCRKFSAGGCKSSVRAGLPRAGSRRCAGVPDRLRPRFPDRRYPQHYGAAFGGKAGYLAPVEGDTYALELWHGPTCAFKDYALQLMPKLLVEAKKNLGRTEKTLIPCGYQRRYRQGCAGRLP